MSIRTLASRPARIALAAFLMGGLLWLAEALLIEPSSHRLAQATLLLILIAAAMGAYGLLLIASGATGWREVVNALKHPADLRT